MAELPTEPVGAAPLVLDLLVRRKSNDLPRFVIVGAADLAPWELTGTTAVEVVINGVDVGRRNLVRWEKGKDWWFVSLNESISRRAGIATGDHARFVLRKALDSLPVEIERLLAVQPSARSRWDSMSASRRRMLCDHLRAARQQATRERRARKILIAESAGRRT